MTLTADGLRLKHRLNGVSARFEPGTVTAICGPNGAGKSSLLSCLAGLLDADSGAVALKGTPLSAMSGRQRAQAMGYLPQSQEAAWDLRVEVLVSLGRLMWPDGASPAVSQAIAAMELDGLRHRAVSSLSGGERARAMLARVLAGEPRWILADEPLANLDLAHAGTILAHMKDQARAGRGVVLVLHDLAAAMNHADRVLVLHQGSVAADGPAGQALSPAVIEQVWGVKASWLGTAGAMALSVQA